MPQATPWRRVLTDRAITRPHRTQDRGNTARLDTEGFYRPDPSYLPAIEQHINDLRADRESAQAMDAAQFVITSIGEEIAAYESVTATTPRQLAELPDAERAEIEQASVVLRKARISDTPALLPLTVLTRNAENPR